MANNRGKIASKNGTAGNISPVTYHDPYDPKYAQTQNQNNAAFNNSPSDCVVGVYALFTWAYNAPLNTYYATGVSKDPNQNP